MAKDFLDEVMQVFAAAAPGLKPEDVVGIEQRVRATWGGNQVYIGKRAAQGKALRLGGELAAGVPLDQAIRNAGLTTRTGYRLLSRKWLLR